jgi:16S rRNA processing protein RimM
VRLTVESCRGEEAFPVVAFREVQDRTAAEALRGHVLFVGRDQLPELDEDEYYPFDLVGLSVRDPMGVRRGEVVDAVESPAHALLVVRLEERDTTTGEAAREVLVPFVTEAVPTVDLAQGHVVVRDAFLE